MNSKPGKIIKLDPSNTKAGKALDPFTTRHIPMIEQMHTLPGKAIMLQKHQSQELLDDFIVLQDNIEELIINHGVFYATVVRMQEEVDNASLNMISDRVFYPQIPAIKKLVEYVSILSRYYNANESNNKAGVDQKDPVSKGN